MLTLRRIMATLTTAVIVSAALADLGQVQPLSADPPSSHSGPNVTVTNTSSNPVPVTLQGTGSISGNVAITNSPNVAVVNPTTSPVPTQDIDNPDRQPFQALLSVDFVDGAFRADSSPVAIPAGQRLVLDQASSLGQLPVGQKLVLVLLVGTSSTRGGFWFLTPVPRGTSVFGGLFTPGPLDLSAANDSLKGYVDGPGTVGLQVVRDANSGTGATFVTLVGHLVHLP